MEKSQMKKTKIMEVETSSIIWEHPSVKPILVGRL